MVKLPSYLLLIIKIVKSIFYVNNEKYV